MDYGPRTATCRAETGRGREVDESGDDTRMGHPETGELSSTPTPASRAALDRAEAAWRRRGYQVQYRDDFLVQLVRRGRPSAVCLAAGLLAMTAVVVGWIACRSWRVVSLSAAPDGRVVTHRQRSSHPPDL